MNTSKKMFQVSAVALMIGGLVACGSDNSNSSSNSNANVNPMPVVPTTQPIKIQFQAKAGNVAVACGQTISGLGSTNASANLKDLRAYVSDVHVMNSAGEEVKVTLDTNAYQSSQIALLDFENGTGDCINGKNTATPNTNTVITGTVPVGTYTGVGFTVGLPKDLNHSDTAKSIAPLNDSSLAWSWQYGRKVLQIELNPTNLITLAPTATQPVAQTSKTFHVHLGSTGCTGTTTAGFSCLNANKMAYHAHSFNAETQQLVLDLQPFFATSDIKQDKGGAVGCMSGQADPECAAIFDALKIALTDTVIPATATTGSYTVKSGESIDGGHGQQLFRVETKTAVAN